MGLIASKKNTDNAEDVYHLPTSKNLLLIFTRNPELGKCKTRLAATIGDKNALALYKFLLSHTAMVTRNVIADKCVYYSEEIWENDVWDNAVYQKRVQQGANLGDRMLQAFEQGFKNGYEKVIVIGSDMFDISTEDFDNAFSALNDNDFVIGPAEDGGYYLLGMKQLKPEVFQNKDWGNDTVLQSTLKDLEKENFGLLSEKNDIDIYEDIKYNKAFEPFLKFTKHG